MSDDLKRGMKLGKYELLLRIGRGGMASVWVARERADNKEDERLVAVKAILAELADDPEFITMFLDEGRLVRQIGHQNVVDVYEVGEAEGGFMYMSMEWVEGDSLHAIIAEAGKRKPIPPEMAVRIVADAAGGLHAAHELTGKDGKVLGVVHRDVSPHNILIGTNGSVKLVDFGVAKAMGRLSQATSAGQLKGKFGYMSPEQAMAKAIDRRADVFALGIVLFELTTGRRLFRGEHDAETLHLVVSGDIPKPTEIEKGYPKALEDIVLKALERDLDRRFQSAKELQDALEGYLKSERIVVARSGIGSLLKRVLGTRIEQRRKAIRAALKVVQGDSAVIAPPEGVFTPTGKDHISVTGVSGITSPSQLSQLTGLTQPGEHTPSTSQPSSLTQGTHSVSQRTRKDNPTGYIVGIAGLLIALVVVAVVAITKTGSSGPKILNVGPQTAAQPGDGRDSPKEPKPAPEPAVEDGLEAVSVDDLAAEPDGGARRAVRATSTRSVAKSGGPTEKAPAPEKPAKPAAPKPAVKPTETGSGPLRGKNPYE